MDSTTKKLIIIGGALGLTLVGLSYAYTNKEKIVGYSLKKQLGF